MLKLNTCVSLCLQICVWALNLWAGETEVHVHFTWTVTLRLLSSHKQITLYTTVHNRKRVSVRFVLVYGIWTLVFILLMVYGLFIFGLLHNEEHFFSAYEIFKIFKITRQWRPLHKAFTSGFELDALSLAWSAAVQLVVFFNSGSQWV